MATHWGNRERYALCGIGGVLERESASGPAQGIVAVEKRQINKDYKVTIKSERATPIYKRVFC
jgi:hypothetical protein